MSKSWYSVSGLAALTALCLTALPEVHAQSAQRVVIDGVGAVEAVRITASVEAVDINNRIVTLRGPRGNVFAVPVGPDVKNLAQVKVGDVVELDYFESIAISVKQGSGMRSRTETDVVAKAKPGERPGAVALRKVTIVSNVLGINTVSQSMLVRGPLGHLVEVKVRDPKVLDSVRGGAQVELTYIEGVAIAVRPSSTK